MELINRVEAFIELGNRLDLFLKSAESINVNYKEDSDFPFTMLNSEVNSSYHYNGWFTRPNVLSAIEAVRENLTRKNLETWLKRYDQDFKACEPLKVGVIMAGNIPLVGFHDMLCVLLSGNIFYGKLSSQDKILIPAICSVLIDIEPKFKDRIIFSEAPLKNPAAVIATGSNNSARYFEYYFGKYPHIIRKNRNSVAVISGSETMEELSQLGNDIFRYFGLGCRNVSKLMVPEGYDFDHFFSGIFEYREVVQNKKYGNNYDYNKTVYLLNKESLLENGFLIIKEDKSLSSPPGCMFYEFYKDEKHLSERLLEDKEKIQCVVSSQPTTEKLNKELNFVSPGNTQKPQLWDYADGIDTMKFVLSLNK